MGSQVTRNAGVIDLQGQQQSRIVVRIDHHKTTTSLALPI